MRCSQIGARNLPLYTSHSAYLQSVLDRLGCETPSIDVGPFGGVWFNLIIPIIRIQIVVIHGHP